MSHLSVRTLISDVAKNLSDSVQFGYGRRSEFNLITDKRYPYIWLLPLSAGRRFPGNQGTKTTTWNIQMVFMDLDEDDANEYQTTKIHDEMDVFVDRFLESLDDWAYRSTDTVGSVTLTNDNKQTFYKDDSGIHSGWFVTFQMTVSDDWSYCTPENVSLYAGDI